MDFSQKRLKRWEAVRSKNRDKKKRAEYLSPANLRQVVWVRRIWGHDSDDGIPPIGHW